MNKTLTPAQRAAFFRALQAASVELGYTTAVEQEAYRKAVMREETGKAHLAQLSRTADFDACMRRFAADAGDYETAARFGVADIARKAALVRICCRQVLQLAGREPGTADASSYLEGIVKQARIACGRNLRDDSFWMDVNPAHLLTLFRILDTHRRRLLRRSLDFRTARAFLKFEPGVEYARLPSGGISIRYTTPEEDNSITIKLTPCHEEARVLSAMQMA